MGLEVHEESPKRELPPEEGEESELPSFFSVAALMSLLAGVGRLLVTLLGFALVPLLTVYGVEQARAEQLVGAWASFLSGLLVLLALGWVAWRLRERIFRFILGRKYEP